jgi:hypothetical protein
MPDKNQQWDRESIEAFNSAHPATAEEQASFDRAWNRLADLLGYTADDIAELKAKFEANTKQQSTG